MTNLLIASVGCAMSWTSPTLLKMDSGETDIPASSSEKSWIGSLTPLGAVFSPFLAGYAADRWGRKTTLLATACPVIVGWVLIACAEPARSIPLIYVGRIIHGLCVGVAFTVIPMYCGEIAEDKVRGALGSFLQIFVSLGSLSQYVVGPYVSYLALTIFSAMVPFLFAVAMWFVPESPYQHVMAGEEEKALEALQWLRGTSIEAVKEELAIIKKMENKSTPRDLISTKASVTALYLSMGLLALQILTGIDAILFYCQDIFAASGGALDSSVATIIVGMLREKNSALDICRRHGSFFGFGPVPWAVTGELFAPNVKSMASSIATSFCWFLAFLVTNFFPTISQELGSDYAFWIFGIFAVVAFVSVFFLLPETKGKSLQEITGHPRRIDAHGETDIPASSGEQSWIGSLTPLGAVFSPFLGGYAADRWGRKTTLLATACPIIVGWVLIACAEPARSIPLIYVGRIIHGLCVGVAFTVLPMYCGEIAEVRVRGALGSLLQIMISVGLLSQYVVGPYVSYLVLTIFSVVVPFLFVAAMWFIPESPYQLIMARKNQQALESLQWLRGTKSEAVKEELAVIEATATALYLSVGLVSLQQLTGINAILFYCQTIFESSGSGLDSSVATIIVGTVMLLASTCTPFVVDSLGRRILLLFSAGGMAVSLAALGTFFHLQNNGSDTSSIGWLPVVSLVVYILVYSVGFGSLPWAVMGELFTPNVKSMAASVSASICWFFAFLITKFFSTLSQELGSDYAIWIFGIFAVVAFLQSVPSSLGLSCHGPPQPSPCCKPTAACPTSPARKGSWIGSLLNLGAFIGAIPAGILADHIGRRTTLCGLAVPFFVSWLMIAFCSSALELYVGRIVGGMAVGAVSVVAPMYISELADSKVRGALGTFFQLQITLGILCGYLVGMVGDHRVLAFILSVLPVVYFVSFIWMPESPVYLLSKDKLNEARRSNYDIEDEMVRMTESSGDSQKRKGGLGELLSNPVTRRALTIALGLMMFQQLSGVNAVIFYTGQIFDLAGSSIPSATACIIIGVVQVIATYVSTLLVDRAGRRILLLISDSVMALCLGVLGAYFHLLNNHYDTSDVSWVPIVSVAIFIVVFSLGFGPIPWIMLGELFPANVKGVASAVAAAFSWILSFAVTKVFQNMTSSLGEDITFWVFTGICVVGTVFVFVMVPETKGKDLNEIQEELSGKHSNVELKVVESVVGIKTEKIIFHLPD
uniref:Major facilitator superfamily (MFS) profile domain-containing protein n=1 Tax=Timema douglasi TaxID=61478 RepID=A0A7R8VHF1_TIMDO|nr:unnamed protein product [Timema douglasi]